MREPCYFVSEITMLRRLRPFFMISDTKSHSSRTPPCFCHFFRYTITQQVDCTGALHIFRKGGYCNMAVIHAEQFLEQIQSSYQFTDLEMKRLKYTLKAVSSELIKTLLLSILFLNLGHLPEFLIGVLVLITIRCNSGGLHMEHFITCFLFTLTFMLLSVIVLPSYVSVPYAFKPVILALCILITFLASPVASKKRPPAAPETKRRYRNRATGLLFLYSVIIIILKTTPIADICFWIIVLQALQLLCAVAAQKGGKNEEI